MVVLLQASNSSPVQGAAGSSSLAVLGLCFSSFRGSEVWKCPISTIFFLWGGCRAASRHVGPAHLGSPGPGPESPVPAGISPNFSEPMAGGRISTVVSHPAGRWCCKRQALFSARTSQAPCHWVSQSLSGHECVFRLSEVSKMVRPLM